MDQKSPEAFRTISEVADWLGVPTHVLRFWESRFSQVKPVKRAGGRRYYRPTDMELLGGIRKLLHEDGMTIRGVQKLLREHGVKHVAAMSPPLETAVGDGSAKDNVVDISDRRDARDQIEDAEIVEETAAADLPESRFPFDDEPAAATADEPEVAPEPAAPVEEAEVESAEPEAGDAGEPAEAATPAEPEEETASERPEPLEEPPVTADEAPAEPDADLEETPVAETAEVDIADPLPAPEAMDFMAHSAPPETDEGAAGQPGEPAAKAPDPETDPDDPMSSPDALSFAAHGGEPELAEDASGDAAEAEVELEAATQPEEPPAPEAAPEPAPAPALVMPEIEADPDDDDREAGPLFAADLRRLRAARTAVDLATLQALGDRLDEIQRRLAGRDGAAGGL